jgi:serine/threonine-protein kinase HipA
VTRVPGTALLVYLDAGAAPLHIGTAHVNLRRGKVTTTFGYEAAYLARPGAWPVSPDLPLRHQVTTDALPGAFTDCAPDRWGRNLVRKRVLAQARDAGSTLPALTEAAYLLGVSDLTRQGALRFRLEDGGPFVADDVAVPPLLELPAVLAATDAVTRPRAADDDMAAVELLLQAGSASLGGARPKASVRHGEDLLIAKFPHHGDEWDVMAWEMTALDLAARCGIPTPAHRLVDVGGRNVLLLHRFDRRDGKRVPYVSGLTMVGGRDGDSPDYLELAESIADHGGSVTTELRHLWRRIAFSIAIHNTDDHLRNHGFLRAAGGWQLSPIFDVNPTPDMQAVRTTTINYDSHPDTELDALMASADYFDLTEVQAREVWAEVRDGVSAWRAVASSHGITEAELRLFSGALGRHVPDGGGSATRRSPG